MKNLGELINEIAELRADFRAQEATPDVIAQATERLVRDRWPFTREWKYLCQRCSDTGLVVADVLNRLGVVVSEGTPCSCDRGRRFIPSNTETNYAEAGKSVKAPKQWTRAGR